VAYNQLHEPVRPLAVAWMKLCRMMKERSEIMLYLWNEKTGDLDDADDGGEAADDDEEAADDDEEGAKVVFFSFSPSLLFSSASRREWPWPSQLYVVFTNVVRMDLKRIATNASQAHLEGGQKCFQKPFRRRVGNAFETRSKMHLKRAFRFCCCSLFVLFVCFRWTKPLSFSPGRDSFSLPFFLVAATSAATLPNVEKTGFC